MLPFYQYIQIVSFLLAIVFYKGLKQFHLLSFIPFLFIVSAIEVSAYLLQLKGVKNAFTYNFYVLLSPLFYMYFFYIVLKLTNITKIVYIFIVVLQNLVIILNYLFIQGIKSFNNYSYVLLSISCCVFSIISLYRISIVTNDEYKKQMPYIIILSATLLFFLGSLIILGLYQFIIFKNLTIGGLHLYSILMPALNVIMYGSYSYAFYLCHKLTKN